MQITTKFDLNERVFCNMNDGFGTKWYSYESTIKEIMYSCINESTCERYRILTLAGHSEDLSVIYIHRTEKEANKQCVEFNLQINR